MKNNLVKKTFIFLTILLSFILITPRNIEAKENNFVNIYVFYNADCLECKKELTYLEDTFTVKYGNKVNIYKYEIYYDEINEEKFNYIRTNIIEIEGNSVPYTIIGNTTFSGYNDTIRIEIEKAFNYYLKNTFNDKVGTYLGVEIPDFEDGMEDNVYTPNYEEIELPIIGKINIKEVSLPIISIILGLIDGFNPCAMWVLLFLISMLLNMKDRKKMWILGITFLVVSALVYLLMMIFWLNIVISVSTIIWVRLLIGLVAVIGGSYNLYKCYKNRKNEGCTIVDKTKRKRIFDRIKVITSENTNFILALLLMALLAISVNVVELACSAGLPLIFTHIIAMNNDVFILNVLYFGLYILFFLIDDLIVFFIAMTTLKITGISTKYGKISQLIGGTILILIGLLLIFKPGWLTFNL